MIDMSLGRKILVNALYLYVHLCAFWFLTRIVFFGLIMLVAGSIVFYGVQKLPEAEQRKSLEDTIEMARTSGVNVGDIDKVAQMLADNSESKLAQTYVLLLFQIYIRRYERGFDLAVLVGLIFLTTAIGIKRYFRPKGKEEYRPNAGREERLCELLKSLRDIIPELPKSVGLSHQTQIILTRKGHKLLIATNSLSTLKKEPLHFKFTVHHELAHIYAADAYVKYLGRIFGAINRTVYSMIYGYILALLLSQIAEFCGLAQLNNNLLFIILAVLSGYVFYKVFRSFERLYEVSKEVYADYYAKGRFSPEDIQALNSATLFRHSNHQWDIEERQKFLLSMQGPKSVSQLFSMACFIWFCVCLPRGMSAIGGKPIYPILTLVFIFLSLPLLIDSFRFRSYVGAKFRHLLAPLLYPFLLLFAMALMMLMIGLKSTVPQAAWMLPLLALLGASSYDMAAYFCYAAVGCAGLASLKLWRSWHDKKTA